MGLFGNLFERGGQLNSMLDPAGIFGGNKGLSQDQKITKMLTGGLVNGKQDTRNPLGQFIQTESDQASNFGPSKNERDDVINSFGNSQKPVFPGAMDSFDPNSGRPNYPGTQSVWARYNPRGGY